MLVALGGCGPLTPATQADACADDASAWCSRAQACKALLNATVTECQASFSASCCAMASSCAAPVPDLARFRACHDAIGAMTCVEVTAGGLPTACQR
jgi:hypothetical protein